MKFKHSMLSAALAAVLLGAIWPMSAVAAQGDAASAADAADLEADEATPVKKTLKKIKKKLKAAKENTAFKIDSLRAEIGGFNDSAAPDGDVNLNAAASMKGWMGDNWEYGVGVRLDAQGQSGTNDYSRAKFDYAENFVRWRSPEMRITLGTQNLLWGRVDEIPPVDRLSRADLSHFVLDRLPDRRRAVPAVRVESFQGDFKIDAAWVPFFDPAVLPNARSVWHPVDTINGRILGLGAIGLAPGMSLALGHEDDHGSGGGGVRVTHTGGSLDYGFSLQRARQSVPYYQVALGFPTVTLTAVHPFSWVLGGELETQMAGATWRLEAAWSSDTPVTAPTTFAYRTEPATDLVMGVEFFPGDGETRVTLQLAGHKTHTDAAVLDRTEFYSVNGELERTFANGRWRGNLRIFSGLDQHDTYLNPKLTYLGIDRHELFIAAHLFSGGAQTLGGFHKDHDMISLGWQAKF